MWVQEMWRWFWPFFATAGTTSIRAATMLDTARISEIHAQCFAIGWGASEIERMLLDGHIADVLVARGFFGDFVAGIAISRVVLDEAELMTIALDPDLRGRGAGRELLRHHIARVRRAGAEAMFLEVAADNAAALRLYWAAGFAEFGRRKGYYTGPKGRQDALTFRRDLYDLDPTPRAF
jgi:ribosomal-protein-alanine N-acetyltransferase